MKLSVVIPWFNRPELSRTLSQNSVQLHQPGVEVLIVNGGGNRTELEGIATAHGWPKVRLVHLPAAAFNKPECLNLGVAFARGTSVLLLDTDIVLSPGFVKKALAALDSNAGTFLTVAKVIESAPEKVPHRWNRLSAIHERKTTTRIVSSRGTTATIVHTVNRNGTRTGPGLISVARKHFIAVGGFNSNLTEWGFEDYDFQLRLQLRLGLKRKTFGRATHLSHQSADHRESDWRNQQTCLGNYSRGDFSGTYRADLERLRHSALQWRAASAQA